MVKTGAVEFESLPLDACWQHQGRRVGFEVAYFRTEQSGIEIDGATTGLEEGATWIASYYQQVDKSWRTRFAPIATRTTAETFARTVESVGDLDDRRSTG
jgi:hypothetical protein